MHIESHRTIITVLQSFFGNLPSRRAWRFQPHQGDGALRPADALGPPAVYGGPDPWHRLVGAPCTVVTHRLDAELGSRISRVPGTGKQTKCAEVRLPEAALPELEPQNRQVPKSGVCVGAPRERVLTIMNV